MISQRRLFINVILLVYNVQHWQDNTVHYLNAVREFAGKIKNEKIKKIVRII
jgi:hypothetical protein